MKRYCVKLLACAVAVAAPCVAYAATNVPAGAQAGRAGKDIPATPTPKLDAYNPNAPKARAPELAPEIAKRRFMLKSLRIRGGHAFDAAALAPYYKSKIGKKISVAQLFDILAAIQQHYVDAGFTLTKVALPDQDLSGGDVYFQVTEGYVAQLDVDPAIAPTPFLDAVRAEILAMHPLNTLRLERLMLLLNDRPGLHVVSILSAMDDGKSPPGAVRLTLKQAAPDQKISGTVGFDNSGSNYVGPYELTTALRLTGATLPNNSDLYLYGNGTPDHEMRQLGAFYTLPVFGASGTTLGISGGAVRTNPGESLEALEVESRANSFGLELNYPLIRQRSEYLQLSGGFNYQNTRTNVSHALLYNDHVRSVSAGAAYSFADGWEGSNSTSLQYSHGLDIFGARKTGSGSLSRAEGHSDFSKLELRLARTQQLTGPWSLKLGVRSQYAFDPLLSSEEFGFGGSQLGRGYDPSEITGDHGFSAGAELRHADMIPEFLPNTDGFVFYDVGKVWNIDRNDKNQLSAASAGFGVHMQPLEQWYVDATLAFPLTRPPQSAPHYVHTRDPRLLVALKRQF